MRKFQRSLVILGVVAWSMMTVAFAADQSTQVQGALIEDQSIKSTDTQSGIDAQSTDDLFEDPQSVTDTQAENIEPAAESPTIDPSLADIPPADTPPAEAQAVQSSSDAAYTGQLLDSRTQKPIADVIVTLGDKEVRTDNQGHFSITGKEDTLKLRAPGYAKKEIPISELKKAQEIELTPFQVKGLYLSEYGAASKKIRTAVLETIKANHLNALVIDVKGDHGFIPFKVDVPLAKEIGAQNEILFKDMPAFLAEFKKQGIYLIARIVVFKDDKLAGGKPEWAVKKGNGFFKDREKLRWADPFRKEVWDYNIAIAKAAAEVGFDEVQFDYVRCPDTIGIEFSQPSTQESRTKTITGFLHAARQALVPYNVMVAADIFGYVVWNKSDTGIGQQINPVANTVDIISLMLYPSGFASGLPKYRNPVAHPYEVIYLTLERAQKRTGISSLRFRPWLQAFRDYAFHGGNFGEKRLREQIKASEDFGSSGYMFWNARNVYLTNNFTDEPDSGVHHAQKSTKLDSDLSLN